MIPRYENFPVLNDSPNCTYCYLSLYQTDNVAHQGQGYKHPIHRECAKKIITVSNLCPYCRIQIDETSLYDWKDKSIVEIKSLAKDSIVGTYAGITVLGFKKLSIVRIFGGSSAFISNVIQKEPKETVALLAGAALGGTTLVLSSLILEKQNRIKIEDLVIIGTTLGAGIGGLVNRRISNND